MRRTPRLAAASIAAMFFLACGFPPKAASDAPPAAPTPRASGADDAARIHRLRGHEDVAANVCSRDVIGAALGGLIGSNIGRSSGSTATTAGGLLVGLLIGGAVGRSIDPPAASCANAAAEADRSDAER
ncbi:MAG TPA: hypothetical protein VFA22_03615 [Stellaceae bacterium]|nr:hypothetical protein [Stellaceae bacterium]